MPADKDAKIACPSAGHLQSELEALSSTLALTEKEETWEKLEKALVRFAAVTRGGGYKHLPLFVEGVGRKGSGPEICSCMISDRGRLSGVGIDLLQTMAPRLGAGFAPLVQLYMEPILKLLGRPNKVVLKRTEKCLDLMISHCHLPSLVTELKKGLSDDAATCRRGCAIGIEKAMSTWDKSVWTAKNVVMLEEGVRKMAVDKDPAVRQTGKKVWGVFQDLWPERVEEFSAPLTPTIRRYLDIANPNGPAKAKPKPKPVVRAAPALAAHPAIQAPGPSTVLPPAQRSASASSSSSSIPPSAPLPKPASTAGITSKPSRHPLDPSTSSIDSMLPPRPQPHGTDNEGTSRAPSRPPYQSHNTVSHFPAPQRSVSHGMLPTSQAASGEVWTRPSRPGIHSSHSTASLPDHDGNTHSVPQRRFPPPARVGRLPSTMEDNADTVDFFGPSVLRGPVRIPPLPTTRLGPAQRRVVTAPTPTATLSTSTSAPAVPYPTAQSVKKRVAELEEEIASNPSSPIPQPHPPHSRPNSTGVSPFNSIKVGRSPVNLRAVNAAFAQPGVPLDSPLLPVLMRSTTREEIAREGDGFEQSDLRNEEELEAEGNSTVVSQGIAPVASPQARQEESDVGQSATSGQIESAATAPKVEIEDTQLPTPSTQYTSEEEIVTSENDLGSDCATALPVETVEPTVVAIPAVSEKPLAGEAWTGPVDKDVPAPEPAQLPLPPSPTPSRALSPIAPIQLDDQALAHVALVDQLVTAKAAVCDKLPTVTSLSKSTTKSAIQTQPRAVSATRAPPPTATSSSAARPPKPPVPRALRGVSTDRRPFRPTSQTASSSGAGGAARQVSNPKTKDVTEKDIAPLKPSITGSSTVSASASTARVTVRVPSATLTSATASTSASASASAARKPPVPRVTKKPATTVSAIPPASDVQAGTEDAAPKKATARPGKTAQVALPPVRKERVSRKPPIPPFIPIRGGGGTKSKATVSTSTTGKASSGIVAKSRPLAKVKPESIPLPLSPAERAKLPPKDIPLPRSPREVIDDIPDTPPRPLAHIAGPDVEEQPSKGLELVLGSPSKSRSPINLKPPRVLSPVLTTVPPTAIAPIPSPKPQNETAPVHLAEHEVEGGFYGDISFDGSIPSPYLLAGRLRGEEEHVDRSIHHTDEAGEVLCNEGVTAGAAGSHDGHIRDLTAEPEPERQLASQHTQSSPTIAQTSPITINTRHSASRTSTPAAIDIPTISPRPAFGERIDVVNTPQRAEGLLAKLASITKTSSPSPGERKVLRVRDANVRGDMEGDGSLGADDRDIQ